MQWRNSTAPRTLKWKWTAFWGVGAFDLSRALEIDPTFLGEDAHEHDETVGSVAIAWSPDNQFIAEGNLDNTLTVMEWNNPVPWLMRGFSGKVRQLAWSEVPSSMGVPMLASCSGAAVVVWERDRDEQVGWASRILGNHQGVVQAIAFQPNSLLLASGHSTDPIAYRCIQWLLLPYLASAGISTRCRRAGWRVADLVTGSPRSGIW